MLWCWHSLVACKLNKKTIANNSYSRLFTQRMPIIGFALKLRPISLRNRVTMERYELHFMPTNCCAVFIFRWCTVRTDHSMAFRSKQNETRSSIEVLYERHVRCTSDRDALLFHPTGHPKDSATKWSTDYRTNNTQHSLMGNDRAEIIAISLDSTTKLWWSQEDDITQNPARTVRYLELLVRLLEWAPTLHSRLLPPR